MDRKVKITGFLPSSRQSRKININVTYLRGGSFLVIGQKVFPKRFVKTEHFCFGLDDFGNLFDGTAHMLEDLQCVNLQKGRKICSKYKERDEVQFPQIKFDHQV